MRASRRTRRARRWRCSAAVRSRTSPTSRSPRLRSAGSRSCAQTAGELAIDADLAAGRHQEVVGEIDALLAENPLRERLHAQRMLALYRCGRQAEALEAYRHARRTLVEEIGVEPAPELRRLHDAILRQDPSLDVEPAVAELPRELDAAAAPPLIGRDGELRRLQAHWQRAAAGAGALVALVGAYGMGKTRMAAEIAGDAHREGAAVLYAAGTGPPEAALAAIARARDSRRPALLVLDDADRAPAEVHAALRELAPRARSRCRSLVLATGQEAAALARLEPRDSLVLEPLDAGGVRRDRGLLRSGRRRRRGARRDAARHEPRRRAPRPRGGGRVGAARGDAPRRGGGRSRGGRPQRGPRARGRAGRERRRAAVGARARRPRRRATAARSMQRWSVRTRGSRRSTSRTPSTSSGASGSSPSWSRASSARRCSAVVGPSGSGKSSVVRAGLLPALAGGVLPGSDEVDAGADPSRRAAAARAAPRGRRLAREWRGVLVVDQFEELFTACRDEQERGEFVARWFVPRATRSAASWCSRCARTSTAAAPPTPNCRAWSAPTTCSSARCRATSSGARSSARRSASA